MVVGSVTIHVMKSPLKCLPLVLSGLVAMNTAPSSAAVRALLVGIGEYPPSSDFTKLDGPPNDLVLMKDWLTKDLGVGESGIVELKDEQATSRRIQEAFQEHLVKGCEPGDVALFYYSGHGTQVEDLGPDLDEVDHKDEALVTWDFTETDTSTWLTDDMLNRHMGSLRAGHVVVMFDSCHAGTGTRGIKGTAGTFGWSTRSISKPDTSFREKKSPENQLFIAACGDGELARQVHSTLVDGVAGAFTEAFLLTVRGKSATGNLSSFETALREETGQVVQRGGKQFSQRPVVESERKDFSLGDFLGGRVFASPSLPSSPAPQVQVLDGFTPSGPIAVKLETSKDRYLWTDGIVATVQVDRAAYVRIFHIDSSGSITQLNPNSILAQQKLQPGETLRLPPARPVNGRTYQLRVTGPNQGLEALIAIASEQPFKDREAIDFASGLFNPIPDAVPAELMSRGIVVEGRPSPEGGEAPQELAVGQAVRIFRTSQY